MFYARGRSNFECLFHLFYQFHLEFAETLAPPPQVAQMLFSAAHPVLADACILHRHPINVRSGLLESKSETTKRDGKSIVRFHGLARPKVSATKHYLILLLNRLTILTGKGGPKVIAYY
ncbi:MAG TPA: hypothetical protein DCP92_17625 [Nitrospiraceae bacterium]|jgi:hypothetical protein|nr:hypothetical protein [Nitrospiraceae bacterium]